MLTRRTVLLGLGAAALGWPIAAFPQQKKFARIGYLANDSNRCSPTFLAFLEGMKEHGWIEKKNLEILYVHEKPDENVLFPDLARNLVAQNVDLIVATGTLPMDAAMKATTTIPIVFGSAQSPVENEFVKSLPHPGANVTGLANLVGDLGPKRVNLLYQLLPNVKRIGRVYHVGATKEPVNRRYIEDDTAAARQLGLTLEQFGVVRPTDYQGRPEREVNAEVLRKTFADIRQKKVGAVYVKADSFFVVNRGLLGRIALEHRMPMVCADGRFVDCGALISYGEIIPARYKRAAVFVDKILRGARPMDLPVEQPTNFEVTLNENTARKLGLLKIPDLVEHRVDRVVTEADERKLCEPKC